jgi:Fe-S cluster assembly iron-binding protein IscA
MITVTPEAIQAIKLFLEEKGVLQPIRIHLQSTGCCDASLGLTADDASADDVVENVQGIMFVIHPDVITLAGDITISYQSDKFDSGFVLTSVRPVSEWSGFGVCTIKS